MSLTEVAELCTIVGFVVYVIVTVWPVISSEVTIIRWIAIPTLIVIIVSTGYMYYATKYGSQTKSVDVEHLAVDWIAPPSVEVMGKTFENERVIIDGRSFVKCRFKNVTMIYNGTAPYRIYLPEWEGHISWQTDNPAIDGAVTIIKLAMKIDPSFKFLVKP